MQYFSRQSLDSRLDFSDFEKCVLKCPKVFFIHISIKNVVQGVLNRISENHKNGYCFFSNTDTWTTVQAPVGSVENYFFPYKIKVCCHEFATFSF